FGEVLDVFGGERLAEACVVRAASVNPCGGGDFQIGAADPDGAGDGQLGQGFVWRDDVHFIDDHAEAIAHVHQGGVDRGAGGGGENQAHGIGLAANRKGMNFEGGLARGNRGADFEHVGAENLGLAGEIVGVVLHEGGAAGKA